MGFFKVPISLPLPIYGFASPPNDHIGPAIRRPILPGNQKSRQNVGGPRGRQDVGSPGPAGTAVFQTAYGPHDQLAATLRADAFRAAPDNAGQPAGLVSGYTNAGHRPDALRGAELPRSHAARGNERKRASSMRFAPTGSALMRAEGYRSFFES